MAANRGMVAGSHNRNEFVMIRNDGDAPARRVRRSKARLVRPARYVATLLGFRPLVMCLSPATSAPSRSAALAMSMSARMGSNAVPSARLDTRGSSSPRVPGDEEEEDVDDLDNEFNYKQGNGKGPEWQGEDIDLSSSSRHEPHHRIPRLTSGQQMSGEIPDASPDRHSIRSPTSSYVDPSVPVPVRIVDPSKDLNSYGLNSVDWKERVESWRVKQDKNMMQVTNKYPDARGGGGDMEGTGSNGEDMQMG
ncbi:unnamed protein product [Triticum turgidum subsp. durum]|uniref:Uncharacterized protein n=1 Tax=Triticum turgidum subsp. durum TaxID=4567 RepID=A0A9R0YGT0_TRITD|nr:unnamed protein product [Triticum turgidum subsp. durum]